MSQLPPAFPISVQLHPDPTSPRNEILDQEEWVEAEDSLAHRYSLMEKWATADQRFRDISNYINPNPSTPPFGVEHTLPALFLRTADFRAMAMTQVGTVVFSKEYDGIWYVLDAQSLQTGLMNVARFESNGSIRCATHRRPFNLTQITIFSIGNGWPLEEIIETGIGGWGFWNQPMDMDLPILDILQGVKDSGKFQYAGWGDKELLAREIERAAPGYLELEAEGRAGEFELERLAEIYT
ncbi:hypothetical protein ASPCAL00364 [Aspergillus calidoustus]|uniref:Uncharacterized protein n=1 Tax=Aspergillus calidoustus TaxID=454130 RepID=A0A0U5FMX1_ASPCI|nr:hypothetical protein ASPCAL00364 [Aspergillus calidoustus]